jgi:hypothetical protein
MEAAKDVGGERSIRGGAHKNSLRVYVCGLGESSPFMYSPRNIMREKRSLS